METAVGDGLEEAPAADRAIVIDVLSLDLETCRRCRGTEINLDSALSEVASVLDAAGLDVALRKTRVASPEQARAAGFISVPTLRVDGQDIAFALRENNRGECGEACACAGSDCPVWLWQGEEHTVAPRAMIVDALLRAVYGSAAAGRAALPQNLEGSIAAQARLPAERAACCSPRAQATCCAPSDKAACCGEASADGCGCP